MEQPQSSQESLDDIRREIDRIDDDILQLVAARLDIVERVRAYKLKTASAAASPIRPGREAEILRRLIDKGRGRVPADLCFRIWRALISAATLKQAPVRIHGSAAFFASATAQTLLREYFGPSAFADHPGEAVAFEALAHNPGDLAAVTIDGPWTKAWMEGRAGTAQVIGVLPFLASQAVPRLLIFGHAAPEQTGADETLVLTDGQLAARFRPAAFVADEDGRLAAHQPAGLPLRAQCAAGRPRALKWLTCALRPGALPQPHRNQDLA